MPIETDADASATSAIGVVQHFLAARSPGWRGALIAPSRIKHLTAGLALTGEACSVETFVITAKEGATPLSPARRRFCALCESATPTS